MFTYVRTEVNYTEEVDDPVDSDGEQDAFTAAVHVMNVLISRHLF